MVPIDKKLIKHSKSGNDFRTNAKKYIVNMTSDKKITYFKYKVM